MIQAHIVAMDRSSTSITIRNYQNTGFQASLQKQWDNHTFEFGGRYTKDHYTYKDYTLDEYNVSNAGDASAGLVYNNQLLRLWAPFLTGFQSMGNIFNRRDPLGSPNAKDQFVTHPLNTRQW